MLLAHGLNRCRDFTATAHRGALSDIKLPDVCDLELAYEVASQIVSFLAQREPLTR